MFGNAKGRRRGAAATLVAGLTALALMVVGLSAGSAGAAPGNRGMGTIDNNLVKIKAADVSGTYTDPETGATGEVVGKFAPKKFVKEDGQLAVRGILKGRFVGEIPDDAKRTFRQEVTAPVNGAAANGGASPAGFQSAGFTPASSHGCDVLTLELGPLDLNVLGLQVDLSQINLDIVAQPGSGNLLGNLLCSVAGLLDGGLGGGLGGLLDGVVDALNGLLNGLLNVQSITNLINQITELLGGATGAAQTQSV